MLPATLSALWTKGDWRRHLDAKRMKRQPWYSNKTLMAANLTRLQVYMIPT